jgi:hypothetical protein
MEWINVKDELPPDGIKVIFLTKHYLQFPDNTFTGVCRGHVMHFSQRKCLDFNEVYMDKVTHWMPLPEPPTK